MTAYATYKCVVCDKYHVIGTQCPETIVNNAYEESL